MTTSFPRIELTPALARLWRPLIPGCADEDLISVYGALIPHLRTDCRVVEVGNAWGRGVIYLASACLFLHRATARVYAVDSAGTPPPPPGAQAVDCHGWLSSMVIHATRHELRIIHPLRLESVQAARLFDRRSLDLVSIDAEHNDPELTKDIEAWAPLVRPGGWMIGHDLCEQFPGVREAVQRRFGRSYALHGTVWGVQL